MISRETLFPKATSGGGSGIKGTWDVTPVVTPAVLPNPLQLVKSTYASNTLTENFSLSGAPEIFGMVVDNPITLSAGMGNKVFGANFLTLPTAGGFGFLLCGYTDNPATLEADVLATVQSEPLTANNFIVAGAGWLGDYGFGALQNKINGTVGSIPDPVLTNVTASSVIGFYLNLDNSTYSLTLDGAGLVTVPFAAPGDGDTVYPFAVFLTDVPASYDGFQFQMKFAGIETSVGGATYEALGTPEIIQQVSSLPVGAAVNDLYVINITESATVKEWMAQPFGINVSNENVIRVVNATQGSEEISLFNEKVGSLFIIPGNFDPTLGQQMDYKYPNALQRVSVSGVLGGKTFSAGNYARWNGIETVPFPESTDSSTSFKIVFSGEADAKSGVYNDFVSAYEAASKITGQIVIEVDYKGTTDIVIPAGTYNLSNIKFKDLSPKDSGVDKAFFSAGDGVVLKYDRELIYSLTVFDLTGLRLKSTTAQGIFSWDTTSVHMITIGEGTYLYIKHNDTGRYFRYTDDNNPNNVFLNFEKGGHSSKNIFETTDLTSPITALYVSDSANSPVPSTTSSGTYSAFDPQKWGSIVYRNYSGLELSTGAQYNFTSEQHYLRGDRIAVSSASGNTIAESLNSISKALAINNRVIFNYDKPVAKESVNDFVMSGENYVGDRIDNNHFVVINKNPTGQFISVMRNTTDVVQGVEQLATLALADGSLAPGSCVAVTRRPNSSNSHTAQFVVLHAGTNNYGTLIKYSWVVGSATINEVGSRDNLTTYPWRGCTYLGNGHLAIFDSNFLGVYTGTLFDTLVTNQVNSVYGGDLSQSGFYTKTLTASLFVVHRTDIGGTNTQYYKFDSVNLIASQILTFHIPSAIQNNIAAVFPVDKKCFLINSFGSNVCQTVYLNPDDTTYDGLSETKRVQSVPYLGLAPYTISLSPYRVLTDGTIYEFSYYLGDPDWLD